MNRLKNALPVARLALVGASATAVAAATFLTAASAASAQDASAVADILKDQPKNWGQWG